MADKPKGVVGGFKDFIMRGNVVDLAVAVVIGTAFSAVVTALVSDILTPIIAAIVGKPNFAALTFTVNHSQFKYGLFVDAVISFLSVAAAVYFFAVVPLNALEARRRRGIVAPEVTTRPCPQCLSDIPKAAVRCAYCTAEVGAIA